MIKCINLKKVNAANFSFKKVLLIFILISAALTIQAQSPLDKKIHFKVNEVPISEALILLSDQEDLSLVFKSNLFNKNQLVTIDVSNKPIHYILNQLLKNTKLTFKEADGLITISKPLEKYIISGFVKDVTSNENLVLANIWLVNSNQGTSSNDFGFFSLTIEEGPVELQISYLGYQSKTLKINLIENVSFNINLKQSAALEEVVISSVVDDKPNNISIGKGETYKQSDIIETPVLAGEADLQRFLLLQNGVQTGADGLGGLHIRGGNSDQNLVLLDDVPIYNPSHTLGLFSIFNAHSIKSVRFIKDGYSAKYGGRLSSVIDIRTKDGNNSAYEFHGEVSALSSKIHLEGPFPKETGGYSISYRRSHIDPILKKISKNAKEEDGEIGSTKYFFYDVNTKLNFNLTKNDRLYLSFYKGEDVYNDISEYRYEDFIDTLIDQISDRLNWGNLVTSLRWNRILNNKTFFNTTFTFSQFDYLSNYINEYEQSFDGIRYEENYLYWFNSRIRDIGIKSDFDQFINSKNHLAYGFAYSYKDYSPGIVEIISDTLNQVDNFVETNDPPISKTNEFSIYLEDKYKPTKHLTILAGFRLGSFFNEQKIYWAPQPRLSLQWQTNSFLSGQITATRMNQFIHVLSSSGEGLPSDLWVPSTKNVRPQNAWQISNALFFNFKKGYSFTVEGYFKKSNQILTYLEGATFPGLLENDPSFWEEEVTSGSSKNYGLETKFSKHSKKIRGWISYSLNQAKQQFPEINEGQSYRSRFVHHHDLKLNVEYQISNNVSIHANWQFGSGQYITLVESEFRFSPISGIFPSETDRISSLNDYKLPSHHRLDIAANIHWKKKLVKHFLTIGVYNIYNRRNPYFAYNYKDTFEPENSGLVEKSLLTAIPSLSYRFEIAVPKK